MTREEFMRALDSCLYALSPEERASAIQYYTEYFDDAGPERERQVIEELGSPREVAKQILKDFSADRYPAQGYRPVRAGARRPAVSWWMILLGVIALPVLLPLGLAVLGVFLGLALSVFLVVVALGAVMVALILAGVLGVFWGTAHLAGWSVSPYYHWFPLGQALVSLGLGLLLLPLCGWLFGQGLPAFFRRLREFLAGMKR
ncbi:MAG: DUF1700 domain-containing protein [Provencibacterium sp.]|jgi:uncharacterized membrane protein|nr:DUF1700 domain-containing protein [Provencibacterium sp.]